MTSERTIGGQAARKGKPTLGLPIPVAISDLARQMQHAGLRSAVTLEATLAKSKLGACAAGRPVKCGVTDRSLAGRFRAGTWCVFESVGFVAMQ